MRPIAPILPMLDQSADRRKHSFRDPFQRMWIRDVLTILQPGKIGAHLVRVPGIVARYLRDVIPVAGLRNYGDHCVMRGASAQGSGARIQDSVLLRDILAV